MEQKEQKKQTLKKGKERKGDMGGDTKIENNENKNY